MEDDNAVPPGVVVGTDGTPTGLRAVAWAAAEAAVRGRPLRIVHAAPYADTAPGRRRAGAILTRAHTVALRREPRVETHTARSDESPVAALVHASRDAELLVVGLLGGHPGDVLAPSIAPALTAAAHCPVTVVRGDHRPAGAGWPVVVGIEDPGSDAAAVTVAFADAARHGSPLVVVHAPHRSTGAREALAEGLRPWRTRSPAVPVEVRVTPGGPEEVLLHASQRARLLVLGTAGHGLAARAALGSTSRTLVRLAPCPVTVVRRDLDVGAAGTPARQTGRAGS